MFKYGGRKMKITGLMVYYYFVCKKKLWYFLNEINMEQNSELVAIGKIIDESSYSREKKGILIDNTINIDFINKEAIIHEVKKTKSIEEAGIWQIKYYMYHLKNKGVKNIKAKIDYPLMKITKDITLNEHDEEILKNVEKEIIKIKNLPIPPQKEKSKICKKCAYFDLCYV